MATNNNDRKISQLPIATDLTGLELVPVVQDGLNKRVTVADILGLIIGGGGGGSLPSGVVLSVNGKVGPYVVISPDDIGAENIANKNQPLGYAGLDASGKVPASLLPDSLFELKGEWDAFTNTPFLSDGSGSPGDAYIVTVAGTVDFGSGAIIFNVGDFLFYGSDGRYFKSGSSTSASVVSVNGKTGVVVLTKDDVGLSQVDNTSDLDKPVSNPTWDQLNLKADIASLAISAFSGSYEDLINKPTIPDTSGLAADVLDLQASVSDINFFLSTLENNKLVVREKPSGAVDGINKIYTLANIPLVDSEQVFLNGILQESGGTGDYTIAGNSISFNTAPESGWSVFVNYATENSTSPVGTSLTFQWSLAEQVYPFEIASNGAALYCKEIDVGLLINMGQKAAPHGIQNFDAKKIHSIAGTIYNTVGNDSVAINSMAYGGNFCIFDSTNVYVHTLAADWSLYKAVVRVVYSK